MAAVRQEQGKDSQCAKDGHGPPQDRAQESSSPSRLSGARGSKTPSEATAVVTPASREGWDGISPAGTTTPPRRRNFLADLRKEPIDVPPSQKISNTDRTSMKAAQPTNTDPSTRMQSKAQNAVQFGESARPNHPVTHDWTPRPTPAPSSQLPLSSSATSGPTKSSVAALVAKLNAVSRSGDPKKALAAIDSILKAESVSESTPRQGKTKSIVDNIMGIIDDENGAKKKNVDAISSSSSSVNDDEVSQDSTVSSITNPTYQSSPNSVVKKHVGKHNKTKDHQAQHGMSTSSFRHPRPSSLAAYGPDHRQNLWGAGGTGIARLNQVANSTPAAQEGMEARLLRRWPPHPPQPPSHIIAPSRINTNGPPEGSSEGDVAQTFVGETPVKEKSMVGNAPDSQPVRSPCDEGPSAPTSCVNPASIDGNRQGKVALSERILSVEGRGTNNHAISKTKGSVTAGDDEQPAAVADKVRIWAERSNPGQKAATEGWDDTKRAQPRAGVLDPGELHVEEECDGKDANGSTSVLTPMSADAAAGGIQPTQQARTRTNTRTTSMTGGMGMEAYLTTSPSASHTSPMERMRAERQQDWHGQPTVNGAGSDKAAGIQTTALDELLGDRLVKPALVLREQLNDQLEKKETNRPVHSQVTRENGPPQQTTFADFTVNQQQAQNAKMPDDFDAAWVTLPSNRFFDRTRGAENQSRSVGMTSPPVKRTNNNTKSHREPSVQAAPDNNKKRNYRPHHSETDKNLRSDCALPTPVVAAFNGLDISFGACAGGQTQGADEFSDSLQARADVEARKSGTERAFDGMNISLAAYSQPQLWDPLSSPARQQHS